METNDKKENARGLQLLRIFDWLRFPLIICVLFIHNYSFREIVDNEQIGGVMNLFSQGICRLAVPIFFFISGYLFFFNVTTFDTRTYLGKLKRRIKSLLVPYLIWNATILFVYYLFYCFGTKVSIFESNNSFIQILSNTFIGRKHATGTFPLVYQMWFIRDLFCVVLISPVINYLLNKMGIILILIFSALWIGDIWIPVLNNYCLSITALFFFSLGAYISYHKINVALLIKNIKISGFLYPIFLIFDMYHNNVIIHNIAILFGIILVLNICIFLEESDRLKSVPFLTSSSFFIFAIHDPFLLSNIRKIFLQIMPKNDYILIFGYFITIVVTVFTALTLYWMFSKLFPKTTSIISGGR